ncbi:ATP-binding cassette domain-containing protein [Verminephrobacter aporrectodeae]|uniref:Sugar ABC transporter ATP-binding protein n=1 Tax=Verminephrobacter aporrectodeae subsp. tuberculatae TaxID=1110392 RepID=A0ABT3KQK3_9BURK|nr:ATP-binding cassette domain-containing protein [Verminephrobacter aporrectodeae]MCW5220475.1 sugar ABC transporter ATP-binding protein [Verminephrobacter aporrectodeae subsp. tuberculatae]MCW5255567.1 sugar ABC transporter ATP-binding protein [Verminephrobacter aporrectodeae subsp. tuberculatae]MCW5289771.1 sugar ABC transporter ATP-binding protein [Verminephrobacter aporrectodeae subsp. tuberculatae]MCW5320596.1 sugar ABC transporter ATP-binding protein [Verminephrobacter aporrectodeae subs
MSSVSFEVADGSTPVERAAQGAAPDSQGKAGAQTAQGAGADVLIRCCGLHKWYSGVHALRDVSLDIQPRQVIGLLGDNGAGKSTLIKILSGAHHPDAGTIEFLGQRVNIRSPKDAMRLGIETIHQYNSMVPCMGIARNIFLGREPLKWRIGNCGWLDRQRMEREAVAAIAAVDLHLRSPDALVGELSGGQRQGVAIARAMHFKTRVLILDEPTNHLSVRETNKVIDFVKGLPAQNMTGIFISHNLHHVFQTCDRIVVMSRGQVVADRPVHAITMDEVQDLL